MYDQHSMRACRYSGPVAVLTSSPAGVFLAIAYPALVVSVGIRQQDLAQTV